MESPTGIIPEELMFPARLGDVVDFLVAMPVSGHLKEQLLSGWARTVGVKLRGSLFRRVRESGLDRIGGPESTGV